MDSLDRPGRFVWRTIPLTQGEARVFPNATGLSRAAADEFARLAEAAVAARGQFAVALAGGATPRGAYGLMADDHASGARHLPWPAIHIFFGDERCVPPDHPESNYLAARQTLLSRVPVPSGNIHRIQAELGAEAAADLYEQELRRFFHAQPGQPPRFDLILLGMGADGHTASLFPGSEALQENIRLVRANRALQLGMDRITFTFPLLNAAAEVVFLVSGKDKAQRLREVLGGRTGGPVYPAQQVQPSQGRLLWLVDEAAASLLG